MDNNPPESRHSLPLRILSELGLLSLHRSPRDVKLLCLQRFVRLFAYGASTLVLVLHLQALGISRTRVGLFMTLTLAGDVCISFALTLVADALGRKAVLAAGAALMAGSGVVFALCENYWVLLAAAIFGVISPSGNEIGPFRAVEESVVAHLTSPSSRADVYAWYSLIGTAGSACGLVVCGWVVHHLSADRAWPLVDAYRLVFVAYAALGLAKLALALLLSGAVEAEKRQQKQQKTSENGNGNGVTETAPLLGAATTTTDSTSESSSPPSKKNKSRLRALLPDISPESYAVMSSLCLFFALDSFASGLAPLSWMTYFFRWRYGIEEGRLGSVFFATSIISAASMLVASSLAKRFGNIRTMVFTHLPSAVFLALIPVFPDVRLSLLFLFLRASTQSMDVAPRSAFLAALIHPDERTAIMGFVNVVKTTAQSLGPFITGVLSDGGFFGLAFVCAGCLKACYDLGLLAVFKNHERHAEERERRRIAADEENGV